MKLVLADLRDLRKFVSREFATTIGVLVSDFGWSHIEPFELFRDGGRLAPRLVEKLGGMPEVVLFWEGYWFINVHAEEIDRLDCHKAVFTDDLHHHDEPRKLMRSAAFILSDTILCTYANAFPVYYPEFASRKRVVWVPHAASPEYFLPFNEGAENAVLLSGALSFHYPLRERMKALCDSGTLLIVHAQHPGYHLRYDHDSDGRVGAGYARRIHRYRAAFCDCSLHRYVLAKHFEIPATGALLVAERAAADLLEELGMIAGVHYVATSHDDLEETVRYVTNRRHHRELDESRRRGQELVRERHTNRERARLIDATLGGR
jgi:hypothetical protein